MTVGGCGCRRRLYRPTSVGEWPDAVWIAESKQPVANDHCDASVAARAPAHHLAHGADDLLVGWPSEHRLVALPLAAGRGAEGNEKLAREQVQKHLRVRARVDMPQLPLQVRLQLAQPDQITVVSESDAIGGIDIEWLRLRTRG
eukprot:scaffold315303_cov30-Tisochrysis_lutea.AAC.3